VLINQGTSTATVSLAGANLPQSFTQYRSTPSQRCAAAGTISSGTVSLPGPGIVTLVAENYDGRTVGTLPAGAHSPVAMHGAATTYRLNGQLVQLSRRAGVGSPRVVVEQAARGMAAASLRIR